MDDDGANPFRFSIPPTAMPPSPEVQAEVFADVAANLNIADKSDPWQSAYVLACCDRLCDLYCCLGFDLLAEFRREMRTDLRSALRKARRVYDARTLGKLAGARAHRESSVSAGKQGLGNCLLAAAEIFGDSPLTVAVVSQQSDKACALR
jgi:hypothetical protein